MEGVRICKFGKRETQSFRRENENVLQLEADIAGLKKLADTARSDDIAKSVTFMGATHAGKSTLIRGCLGLSPEDPRGPLVAKELPKEKGRRGINLAPTTGHIYCYNTGNLMYLDVEGDSGGNVMPTDIGDMEAIELNPEYFKKRRAAVQEHLPRFAYVTTDVIVYVSMEHFASHEYYTKIQEVAKSASSGVVNAEAPCLILVQNKVHPDDVRDAEELTEDFFDAHDQEKEMLNTYLDVKCLQITHARYGSVEYQAQINLLLNAIHTMIEKRKSAQRKLHNSVSTLVWSKLLYSVLVEFHAQKCLRMGNILTEAILSMSDQALLTKNSFYFFGVANYTLSKSVFLTARKATLQILACLYHQDLLACTAFDQDSVNSRKTLLQEKSFQESIHEIIQFLHSLEPCDGVFSSVQCQHTQNTHLPNHHHNPGEGVYSGATIMRQIRSLLKIQRHRWEGKFVFEDPENDQGLVTSAIEFLLWIENKSLSLLETRILQIELMQTVRNNEGFMTFEPCYVCFASRPIYSLYTAVMPCGHFLCSDCSTFFKEHTLHRVPGILDTTALIDPLVCAICSGQGSINGVSGYASDQTNYLALHHAIEKAKKSSSRV